MLDSAGMTTYEHLAKDQKKKGRFMLSITLVLLLVLLWPFSLHAQAPFYQGKTDAKKKKLELDPVPGEELEALAKEIIAQPPDVIERMKKLLGT